ncbi:hypothetical protein TSOC_002181, partial [Tetrabaena socialis]
PSGQEDASAAAARRRAPRGGGASATPVTEVAAVLAMAGVNVVPDGHEEAQAAAEAAASGSETFPTLESLTATAKATIIAQIGSMLEERGRDEMVEVSDLKRCLTAGGMSISSAALEAYVLWVSTYRDVELAKGNYLPDIAYDVDSKLFSFM